MMDLKYILSLIKQDMDRNLYLFADYYPLLLSKMAVGALIGVALGPLLKFILTLMSLISPDILIVLVVFLGIGLASIWNNPRFMPAELRLFLLRIISGKDTLIANGDFNVKNIIIYVDESKDLIMHDSRITVGKDDTGVFAAGKYFVVDNILIERKR